MSIKSKEMTFDERLSRLRELIQQFKENESFYTSKDFVKSEIGSKFIDPFLECLKWDVKNEKGARPDKREVITEESLIEYYKKSEVASHKIDLFHLFFEKAIHLLKEKGLLGFITPNTYLTNKYIKPLRIMVSRMKIFHYYIFCLF